ncbi:MAG TPA: TlpA disulfide reductase family protein [Pyrinomonadaceae bacterium]|nr:TlpA disulfide reductase family protein [Pyrinomonadaceae bacterium]
MALKKQETGPVKFWSPLRLVSTLIVLGLLAAFGASSCNSNDPESKTPATAVKPSAAEATPVVPAVVLDTELPGANGQPIKLSNYSGKVLLVNLWATWCGPCRRETPELVRLHKEYQSRGVEMVGLSTEDPVASAQSVHDFVQQFQVDYQVGWATREVAIALMQMTGKSSIPQSFIITRNGRIKKRFIGFHPVQTPPLLKQAIEDALIDNG